ncbi:ankyrin repeat and MYND domain-containing protein 2 [Trichonephila clavipes]|nr:ankyrin repeat and MYND domain-containing protein 2 [Trichonephila clavipes]
MITNYFIPELNNHDVQELWFQQDGATCHTARATIDLLKDTFGDRLISRFGPVNWPPRSCDLTPLDYFLWGYVKSLIYADKPQTLDHLEDNIRRVMADIRPQMLEKVIENWTSRLDYIRASRGSPMPEIIFKIVDADGITPRQHAADTGTYEVCKLLLECGADVNLTKHFAQYSALTFATLSGNLDVVSLLLQSGASTTSVSSNNKTSAQMATSVEECLNFLNVHKAESKAKKENSSENESKGELTKNCLDPLIKYLIKGDPRGFPIALENLFRRGIQQDHYLENSLQLQLVITLKSVQLGAEPSTISIINGAVDGHCSFLPF